MALGANKILMHKMGCLGPIDPSVANQFNPPNPMAPGQFVRISVEDVTAFFKLVKEDVGITHEDELVQALRALTDKIHPLALGNVQRSHNQSRLIARKLLRMHMSKETQEHEIETLIDSLKSNLFYHGHPINRDEAIHDLKLKAEVPSDAVESAMWNLYLEYEKDLKILEPFLPVRELELKEAQQARNQPPQSQPAVPPQPVPAQQVTQFPFAIPGVPMVSSQVGVPKPPTKLDPLSVAYVESVAKADVFSMEMAISRVQVPGQPGQEGLKQEITNQSWREEK
jgi:hypothetical protein